MRRKVALFLFANVFVVGVLLNCFWPLISLLILDGSEDAISRAELPAPNSEMIGGLPQLIPKTIHQTWISTGMPDPINGTYTSTPIPEVWRAAQQSCITLHDDYEYKLWTDLNSRPFIKAEYPWFIETWDSYIYPIERADAIRYFALVHFGGIYIDLDDGCQRRLDPLLAYPAWVRSTVPTGIGNDVLGAVPGHPFFLKAIDSLSSYNRNWFSPYITIMASTGPLYLSLIWRQYNLVEHAAGDRVRILGREEYMSRGWSFFSHHLGNSWHMWDAEAIFWLGKHWIALTVTGFVIAGIVFAILWWVYGRMWSSNSNVAGTKAQTYSYNPLTFWRRMNRKDEYELVERREV